MHGDIANNEEHIPKELVTETRSVDPKAPVAKVLSMLSDYPAVIVNVGKSYRGIVDARSVFRARAQLNFQKNQTIERYIDKVPTVDESTKIDELVVAFHKSRSKALPFMQNGKAVGLFSRETLLKVLLSLKFLEDTKVGEAMSAPVIGINEEAGLSQAKSAMENNRVNRLLVFGNGKPTGLVTYSMLVKNFSAQSVALPQRKSRKSSAGELRISEIIEGNPRTVPQGQQLSYAVRSMLENDISALLVVGGRGPVGILTATDVIESVMAKRRLEENRIFISGMDDYTKEYEDEIRGELKELVAKIERRRDNSVEYIVMHLKRIKTKIYDIRIRISIRNRGIISSHVTDFMLDRTFKEALDTLKKDVMKEKERRIESRKKAAGGE